MKIRNGFSRPCGQLRGQVTSEQKVESPFGHEREVLEFAMHVPGGKAIAGRMGVTIAAVNWHLQPVCEKLVVHSRIAAALKLKHREGSEY